MLDMRVYMAERRAANRTRALDYLGGKCAKCGSKHDLQFDHKDRLTKAKDIADMFAHSWAKLVVELNKCQLLCIDCHRVKTQKELGGPSTHGRLSYYKHHGCRCNLCRRANADARARWREKHRSK